MPIPILLYRTLRPLLIPPQRPPVILHLPFLSLTILRGIGGTRISLLLSGSGGRLSAAFRRLPAIPALRFLRLRGSAKEAQAEAAEH